MPATPTESMPNKGRARSAKSQIMSALRKSQNEARKAKDAKFRAQEKAKATAARAQGKRYKTTAPKNRAARKAERQVVQATKVIKKGLRTKYIDLNKIEDRSTRISREKQEAQDEQRAQDEQDLARELSYRAQQEARNAQQRQVEVEWANDDEYVADQERQSQILKYIIKREAERRAAIEKNLADPTLSNPADYIDDIIL